MANKSGLLLFQGKKNKEKTKRVVVFTDKDPGRFDTDVSENILTDYANKHTVKKKIGRGYDTGKTKNIIKVPKADYKKNKPLIKTELSKATEDKGYYVPTTPRDTKRLTKKNRRIGARYVEENKLADRIDKKIDRKEKGLFGKVAHGAGQLAAATGAFAMLKAAFQKRN
jgi:hypothetical protein